MAPHRDHDRDMMDYQSFNNEAFQRNNQDQEDNKLDMDHPNSSLWPEVFPCGREEFPERFFRQFPWARGMDPFEDDDAEWRLASEYLISCRNGVNIDLEAEAPPVLGFVKSLTSLELDDLPDDDHHCPICRDVYRGGEHEEIPLVMPCEHVIGKDCLLRWLSSISGFRDESRHDSCPVCRMKLVAEVKRPLDTVEGLGQLLRDANFLLTAEGPLTLTAPWRDRWEGVKQYVNAYIDSVKSRQNFQKMRRHIFIEAMYDEISETVWNTSTSETLEQMKDHRGKVLRALDKQNNQGLIEAYLNEQANEDPTDSEGAWTLEEIMAEFKTMPFDLGRLIQNTYQKCVDQGRFRG